MSNPDPNNPPPDLDKAGRALEAYVEDMIKDGVNPQSIASALLGATLHFLSASLGDEQVIRVLNNAINGVRSGQLRPPTGPSDLGATPQKPQH
jgi:hypothetical protein